MKTIAVVSIVLLSFMKIQAQDQIKQGVYTLSGSIGYLYEAQNLNSQTIDMSNYYFGPTGSYFIIDQIELLFGAEYYHYSTTFKNANNSSTSTNGGILLGVGPRYYFPCGKVAPFIGANGSVEWLINNGTSSSPQISYGFIGGIEIFISNAAALEPSIKYEHLHIDNQNYLNVFMFSIGVKYFIF
jgi:hypothetical protein